MYAIDSMSFKVILLRSALKRKEEAEKIIKGVKLLNDNLSTNEINVLGDSLEIITQDVGQTVIKEGDEFNEEKIGM